MVYPPASHPSSNAHPQRRGLVLLVWVILGIGGFFLLDQSTRLGDWILDREAVWLAFLDLHPMVSALGVGCFYALWTGCSLPGAALLTLLVAWGFGFWMGLLVVSLASTTGATMAFLISRHFLQPLLRARWPERWKQFELGMRSQGPLFLFSMRLMPVVPFFMVNLLAGCAPMKCRTYWWVTQLGMLPGTLAYVYAGSVMPSVQVLLRADLKAIITPSMMLALIFLALLPLMISFCMRRWKRAQPDAHLPR